MLQMTVALVQDAASLQYVFGPARRKDGTWRYNLLELFILNGTEEKRATISRHFLAFLGTESGLNAGQILPWVNSYGQGGGGKGGCFVIAKDEQHCNTPI